MSPMTPNNDTSRATHLASFVGRIALLRDSIRSLCYPVTIKDAAYSYGQVRFLVTVVGGTGERWVTESSIAEWMEA